MRFVSLGECMVELRGAGEDLWRMGVAGDTLNTAWYARACLPADWSVAYATAIGTDDLSARVPAFLADNGIETDRILTHPTRTIGLYAISLTHGERSFTYWRDTSAARTLADDPARLAALTDGAQVLHVSGITLAILPPDGRRALLKILHTARAAGVTVSLDPNLRPALWEDMETARQTLTEAARAASVVLPSFDDERTAFDDATPQETRARYAALGADTVAVKNGGAEIHARHHGTDHTFTPTERLVPVDTTGAGDSFNGAFLASLAVGGTLEAALADGHRVAATVIGQPGALVPMATVAPPPPTTGEHP